MNVHLQTTHVMALLEAVWTLVPAQFENGPGSEKIPRIKKLRELIGCGLREAKDLVEAEYERQNPPPRENPVARAVERISRGYTS